MSHPDMISFVISIDPNNNEQMNKLNDAMDQWQDEMVKYEQSVANKLGVSYRVAWQIVYLRSRSRWSQEKEDLLVRIYKEIGEENFNVLSGEEDERITKLGYTI